MKAETFVEYLRRVGSDYQASYVPQGEACPTAEDYQRAADTIEDLARALARMVHALKLDDMSGFERDQREAINAADRLLKRSRPLGKVIA